MIKRSTKYKQVSLKSYSWRLTRLSCKCATYTVGHKKRATLFWTVTSAFLDGFQQFVYQQKKE